MNILRKTAKQISKILSEKEQELYSIYLNEFNDCFYLILRTPPKKFIEELTKRVQLSKSYKFNDFSPNAFTNVENYFSTEVYAPEYELASTAMKFIKSQLETNPTQAHFDGKITPHCLSKQTPIHSCGSFFYLFTHRRSDDQKEPKETYLICTKCEEIYKKDFVKFHCKTCSIDYFSKAINEDSIIETRYQIATWNKYHCNILLNDYMKCIKCKQPFYLELQSNSKMLTCLSCNLAVDQTSISWRCILCKNDFNSEAKPYNPLEYKNMKLCVKEALLGKVKARPEKVPCCSIDLSVNKFVHNMKCNGELYMGEMNKKKIVVCSKCEAFNDYDNYAWKCPQCNLRFTTLSLSTSNNTEPVTSGKYQSNNKKIIYDSAGHLPKETIKSNAPMSPAEINTPFDLVKDNKRMSSLKKKNEKIFILSKQEGDNCKAYRSLIKKSDIPKCLYSSVKMNLAKKFSGIKLNKFEEDNCLLSVCEKPKEEEQKQSNSNSLFSTASSNVQSETSNHNTLESNKQNDNIPIQIKNPLPAFTSTLDIDNYNIIKLIGSGSFGKIYKVQSSEGKYYAIKKLVGTSIKELNELSNEYQILLSLLKKNSNLNLVSIHGIQTKQLDQTTFVMYVLMDLAEMDWENELTSRYKAKAYYSERKLISIFSSLIKTFSYLQKHNISHRDIKPQNILVFQSSFKYKLSDFGEAKILQSDMPDTNKQTLRGTELYMAPILFKALRNKSVNLKHVAHNTYKSDVFSFGLCALYAATLTIHSLTDIREVDNMNSIRNQLNKYLNMRYSQAFIDLMAKMLDVNEKTRNDFIELERVIDNYCI